MEIRKATEQDWITLQGGKPELKTDSYGIPYLEHPNGTRVTTPEYNESNTTLISVNGDPVEFITDEVWFLHGKPCETRSRQVGGDAYERTA